MRVLVLRHLAHEHAGVLGEVLVTAHTDIDERRLWEGDPVPADPAVFDAIAVLGGDMDTDEDAHYPFLAEERRLLEQAVARGVPTLGLCLGAQLLAEATGGSVAPGVPEIGWLPIRRTAAGTADPVLSALDEAVPFFNAHRDHITLGPDATLLAWSTGADATAGPPPHGASVHAFRVGAALGLQFHPEIDASFVAAYVEAEGVADYLAAHGWTPERLVAGARHVNARHRAAGQELLAAWLRDASGAGWAFSTAPELSAPTRR